MRVYIYIYIYIDIVTVDTLPRVGVSYLYSRGYVSVDTVGSRNCKCGIQNTSIVVECSVFWQ